jgi:vitamin B12 transporter
MKKSLWAIIMIAILLFLALPASSLAESTQESADQALTTADQDHTATDQDNSVTDQQPILEKEVVVTALRIESKDLVTPAYINSYTQEQLKNTGAVNVLDALQFTEGIIYNSMGPGGQSYSTMNSKAIIRGAEKGTLVLVDGVKMNMNGYYNLEDIPLENVERVEVVKGAASVLYGSEAFGGVINILTKKKVNNRITLSRGGFNQINHSLSVQAGNFNLTGTLQGMGKVKEISNTGMAFGGNDKQFLQWSYHFNDRLSLTHSHTKNDYSFDKYSGSSGAYNWGIRMQSSQYDDSKDYLRLCYRNKPWKLNVYWNYQDRDYNKDTNLNTAASIRYTQENYQFSEYGFDAQTIWNTPWATFLGGFGYARESYREHIDIEKGINSNMVVDYSRNGYFFFGQGTKSIGELTTVILGVRQEFNDNGAKENVAAFCPQLQILRELAANRTWYLNIGKSFKMPTLKQLYDETGELAGSNADLQPEKGWNYETGLKWRGVNSAVTLAVFHMDYDSIKYVNIHDGTSLDAYYKPRNTPFRNTGLELSYTKKLAPNFSYKVGTSYGNPEERTDGVWKEVYGKWQIDTTLRYKFKQWTANFSANYFTDRAVTDKPQLPVNLTAAYAIDQNRALNLAVTNLLNRRDINNHNSIYSYYYALPRSVSLSYTQRF